VDDDPSVLPALARLIRAAGLKVATFDRPSALLASEVPATNACMLVDVHLPEMSGIQLCEALVRSGRGLPAIIITGRNDVETRRVIARASGRDAFQADRRANLARGNRSGPGHIEG
jgi:FixJ family two-component response regulator